MRILLAAVVLVLAVTPALRADPADPAGLQFFETKIRPLLVEHCYSCHSAEAKKVRGKFLLDSRAALRKGGESGPGIVPGKADESLLIKAVRYTDPDLKMPPKGKLPAAAIADLEAWVKMGAPDPRDRATSAVKTLTWEEMLRDRRGWWSLQPVKKPAPPTVHDSAWSPDPVDRFILARLEAKGLSPAAPANRRTLIRRLSLVLTGLPPTPAEIDAFLGDAKAGAVERLVDRLLASPHFGERWARHWMDVVRFSETHGNEWNYDVHHAWRYRDYLIRAFNDDVPYDQMVREHLAGDLLAGRTRWNKKEKFNESVIGTAFYRFGEVNHDDCIALRQIGYDIADNQLDTLTKAFQATTVACARCHDHKIDAVSTKDYYALLGIIRSSRQVAHTLDGPEVNAAPMERLRGLKSDIRKELGAAWIAETPRIKQYLLAARAALTKAPEAAALAKGLDAKRLDRWVAALSEAKAPRDDVFGPWRALSAANPGDATLGAAWRKLGEDLAGEEKSHAAAEKQFVPFADFRSGALAGWQAQGQGLRHGPSKSGDVVVAYEGDAVLRAVLPAGVFTNALSDKLNGALRSPLLPKGKRFISFQVMGKRSSAVRLVSSNCQLNYKNYRALISDAWIWITFPIPEDLDSLRTYAELMTLLDNPKFPDQLSALGGDPENYRLPWEKAAANPRSYFGVTRVVLHDGPEPPRAELGHLLRLFDGADPASFADVATRYGAAIDAAVRAWADGRATDEDVRWLDNLVKRGLLPNDIGLTPRLAALAADYRKTEATLALPRVAPGLADFGPGYEQPVFARGDWAKPGGATPRRYLEVLTGPGASFAPSGSGRLELAERIAGADNPLTARVMVNRVWHHLFGAGVGRTVDDFGRVGELPSHAELLDYLAARFVDDGWSIKRLIRSIVLTRTFQMSNLDDAKARETDPENRLLHCYPARRMEAEAIRDSILAASGRLDPTLYGMSITSYREKANADRRLFPGPLDGAGRRSIYIKNTLMEPPRFLDVFDFPGGKVTQGRRNITNVPAQALTLLNDPFVVQQAEVWAGRLMADKEPTLKERIARMFTTALGRPPNVEEQERFEEAALRFAELHGVEPRAILESRAVWQDMAHTMYNMKEFIYIP
ncbi:MAG: PSD1 and planctomycete cytochrome C domain-containing protein [Gemmataceae bacterium]